MNNRGSSNCNRSSMDKGSSMCNSNRSSMSNSWSRSINSVYKTMSKKTMPKKTMSKKTTSNDLSISISSGGSKATANKDRKNSKIFHIGSQES